MVGSTALATTAFAKENTAAVITLKEVMGEIIVIKAVIREGNSVSPPSTDLMQAANECLDTGRACLRH